MGRFSFSAVHNQHLARTTMVNRLQHLMGIVPEATQYTDYYEIEAIGDTFIVALSTVLYVERQLDQCDIAGWVEFRDVFGARHRLPARCIYRITESTRETRAAVRAFEKVRRDEGKEFEDPFEDL